MKRKLIDYKQENSIECDEPTCDYVIPNDPKVEEAIDKYLNKPCPKCNSNLLTERDLILYKNFKSRIDFINKWFSWLTIFSIGKKEYQTGTATFHKGVKIEVDE